MHKANFKRNRFWFAALGVLSVILVVLLVMTALGKAPQRREKTDTTDEEAVPTETVSASLKMNAYPKVNVLIEKFYAAQVSSDTDTLSTIVIPFSESDQTLVARKSEFIESYENINCYSEDGADEGTYIVFATYDLKFPDVDATVPGLETLIVCTDESGELYINNDQSTLSDAMSAQLTELLAREDVVALFAEIQTSFNTVVQSDESIRSLCEQMGMDVSSITETEEPAETETAEPSATETTVGEVNKEMMAVQDLEVYADAQGGDVLGTAPVSGLIYVYENVEGGYSYIQVESTGLTGYVLTTGLASYTLVDQEVSATVNYYGYCSDSAPVLGTITTDASYYCTLSLDNGWSQILVNSTKVYVKTSEIGLE